ncbi:MAG: Na+/H+ antiporter NhaC family protein [Lachnospiraceae bacterium]|nr:Na+/H+ antiporter NhaC family protein [Lachnospiraceae bacterium]
MTKRKKVISIIILAMLLASMFAITVFAGSETVCTSCWGDPAAMAECEDCGGTGILESDSAFAFSFWALVPPIVAIALALITKETYSSLFVGIVVGSLLAHNFAPVASLDSIISEGFVSAICDNAGNFVFLVLLGAMVALVNATGAAAAFGKWAAKHAKGKASALIATFILGVLIFIDDYFNCLTVGTVMKPVTDKQHISRVKLAYLIDATAAPICMIAPVSSWAAAVSGVADSMDAGINGIQLFIKAIPFNFYSLMSIVFVVAISIMGFDYGPMAKAELEAEKGKLGSLGNDEEVENPKASLWDMIIPVAVLIVACVIGLIYAGGFYDAEGGNYHDFIGAFGDTDAFFGLPWGTIIAFMFTILYLICRKTISFKDSMACLTKGFNAMVPALLILTCAVTLKNMTGLLGASNYVASLVHGAAAGLMSMLPAIIFVVACVLAFSTGTSWGTFGILIPIVLPLFGTDDPLLMIGISACLAGAVCGDHCSPISDTTIMASAGANVNHLDHVSTQLPYAITVAAISFVNFIIAGFVKSAIICIPVAIAITIGTLFVLKKTIGTDTSKVNA